MGSYKGIFVRRCVSDTYVLPYIRTYCTYEGTASVVLRGGALKGVCC